MVVEPFSALGAAASIVQLADVALRASREACEFLNAIKNARQDVMDLKNALLDVETNVRNLRNYIAEFSKSKGAKEEFEILPDTITKALVNFNIDIDTIKKMLPLNASPSLAQKIRWVYSKRKVNNLTQRLRDRKEDLILALSITQSNQNMKIRQDLTSAHTWLKVHTDTVVWDQAAHLSHFEIQHRRQTESSKQLYGELRKCQLSLGALQGELLATKNSILSALDSKTFVNVLSSEPHPFFRPSHRPTLKGSFPYNEAGKTESKRATLDTRQDPDHVLYEDAYEGELVRTQSTSRYSWCIEWQIGSFLLEVTTTSYRTNGRPDSERYFSMRTLFRPGGILPRLPGVSTFYSNAPNKDGLYQLAPMITVFPIISREHPISKAIWQGDVHRVRDLLTEGGVSPRCQFQDGTTLLHYAVSLGQSSICRLLLSVNPSLYEQRDWLAMTPIQDAIGLVFEFFCTSAYPYFNEQSGKSVLDTLRLLEDQCDDIDAVYEELARLRYTCFELSRNNQMDIMFEGVEYLHSRQPAHAWRLLFSFLRYPLFQPTREATDLLKMCLRKGLDPNFTAQGPSSGLEGPLLLCAIIGMGASKSEVAAKTAPFYVCESSDEEDNRTNEPPTVDETSIWCIAKTLIEAGADIYHINSDDLDIATDWTQIRDLWYWAKVWEVTSEWKTALQECGIDPDEAYQEGERRLKHTLRLQGAKRTGFDDDVLALPSFTGLRYRGSRGVGDDSEE